MMTLVQISIYLRELGASIQQLGLFFTTSLIFPLLLRIFGGWLSDVIGRLKALTIGSVAGMLAFVAYTLAPSWQTALLAPALLAVTVAFIFPSYKAYIADQTSENMRGRIFGLAEAIITISWILGPPIGGLIAHNLGYRWMFAIAALCFAIATILFFGLYRTQTDEPDEITVKPSFSTMQVSFKRMFLLMLSGGLVTWILIVDGVRDVAFKLSFDLMPVYLSEIGLLTKQQIGFLDGLFGVAFTLTAFLAGILVDRTSERVGITVGLVVMIFSRLVFAIALTFWGFAFSWVLLGIGGGFLDPAASSLIARGVPRSVRGLTYGLVATSLSIISLPAPWIGSQMWNLISPRAPFLLTVILASLIIVPAWSRLVLPDERWEGVDADLSMVRQS
ncbi:MAG: MFS transporter [Anaerolineales bacterium]|nr:MFS transporter [Anaerolineales bacterium]